MSFRGVLHHLSIPPSRDHPCILPSIHRGLSIHLSMTKLGIFFTIYSFLSIQSIHLLFYLLYLFYLSCLYILSILPTTLSLRWLWAVSGAMVRPRFNPGPRFGWVWVGFGRLSGVTGPILDPVLGPMMKPKFRPRPRLWLG